MQWLAYLSMTVLMLVGFVLIFVILLQRGRGGGLAGALGGMGGQSAFGTKAGDVFTKITVGLAVIWVVLAAGSTFALRTGSTRFTGGAGATANEPAIPREPEGGLAPSGGLLPGATDMPSGGLNLDPPLPFGAKGGDTSILTKDAPATSTPAEQPPASDEPPAAEKAETTPDTPPPANDDAPAAEANPTESESATPKND